MKHGKILAAAIAAAALFAASQARADGDPAAGEKVFKSHLCFGCHSFQEGKKTVGPNLHGVFGRKAGTGIPGTQGYSDDLKNSGIVWNEENLEKWVQAPKEMVAGTKMLLAKPVTDEKDRENLAAYIKKASQ
jgi:cytochrome c